MLSHHGHQIDGDAFKARYYVKLNLDGFGKLKSKADPSLAIGDIDPVLMRYFQYSEYEHRSRKRNAVAAIYALELAAAIATTFISGGSMLLASKVLLTSLISAASNATN